MSTLCELFKIASNTFGNNYAIISYDEVNHLEYVTYQSLATESEHVSKYLQEDDSAQRPGPGPRPTHDPVIIGLYMEQTVCFPALVLGILQQSYAFLCLNLSTTEEEFLSVSKRLNLARIITVKSQRDSQLVPLDNKATLVKVISVNGIAIEIWHLSTPIRGHGKSTPLECFTLPESLAYVVMTSGTCGRPKVVRVPHKCIVPNIQNLRTILKIGSDDIVFLAAPLSFDPSVVELFLALASGAAILIVPNVIKASPSLLLDALFPEPSRLCAGTTILQMTPSVLSRWSDETIRTILFAPTSTLRALILGGEPCPNLATLKRWKTPASRTEIYNIYGITEVSCWASIHKVDVCDESTVAIPLGSALSETVLQVRNHAGEVIDDGEGEMFIGSSLRVCQIDSEGESSNLSPPVFRATGDIVNVSNKTNATVFVSRKNSIIKRWGHRVDLLQIEETARQHDAVENCSCIWDRSINTLCLFVKTRSKPTNTEEIASIRIHLANHVRPSAMPDIVLGVSELPLTPHGKVDMRRLGQTLRREVGARSLRRPTSALATFAELWSQCLGCVEVRPGDTFTGLGGTSIEAMRVARELERCGYSTPAVLVLKLLTGSTFEECCGCLNADAPSEVDPINPQVNVSRMKETNDHAVPPAKKVCVGTEHATKLEHSGLTMSSCRGRTFKYPEVKEVVRSISFPSGSCLSLTVGWTFDLGKCVDASPLCLNYGGGCGKVVVGSHSHSMAILHTDTGELVSAICQLPDRIESSACVSVCGKYAFVGCYDGSVYCLNIHTSGIEWRFQTKGMVKCSPVLCLGGAAIVVGSYDKALYCIHVTDGSLVWSTTPGSGGVFSSPCVGSQTIYAATLDGTACAVSEITGGTIWTKTLGGPVFSGPVLIHDGRHALFAEVAGLVHALCSHTGQPIWSYQADGNIFSSFCTPPPKNNKQIILFGCHDKHLYCLEASSTQAHLVWKSKMDSAVFATPFAISVEQDQKGGDDDPSLVVVATVQGSVRLVNVCDGKERCSLSLPHEVFSSPVVSGNQIIVGCRDNNVYSLNILPVPTL